jgi:hypothetical protein
MSAEQRNISLTITLNLETQLYAISGSIPNPSFGVMLAEVLREEMRFRMRMALSERWGAARGLDHFPAPHLGGA